MKCPTCKGTKEVEVSIVENNKESKIKMPCYTCKETGEITAQRYKEIQAWEESWCNCKEPSEALDFFDDGQHPQCYKHHWRCRKCQKIVQIG